MTLELLSVWQEINFLHPVQFLYFSAFKAVVATASLAACLYVGLLDGSDVENLISNVAPYTPAFNCWQSINIVFEQRYGHI